MSATTYRAFITYSHADAKWADWLHRALETYRIPRHIVGQETVAGPVPPSIAPVFRDREELAASPDLPARIEEALSASDNLIVLCSPNAVKSVWVEREILQFKRLHGESRIFAVIVGGDPAMSDMSGCFPNSLRFRLSGEGELGTEPVEPVAADLRPGKDGKKNGLLKLVAGLTGVRLDELAQRDAQRRASRLRVLASVSVAIAMVMSGLALVALLSRNEAERQREAAETARGDAEGLVEFMLTDLREQLDAVGRLDTFETVGDRALAYYDARELGDTDADALGRRARAQLLVGEVANLRGDLEGALESYRAAAKTTGESLRRNPRSTQQIYDHAQSLFWVGYVAWQRSLYDEAARPMHRYLSLAKRLVELEPENEDWQAELQYAHSNVGTLALERGQYDVAELHFQQAFDIADMLARRSPRDVFRAGDVASAHSWLASLFLMKGDLSESIDQRRGELAVYDRFLVAGAENVKMEKTAVVTCNALAHLYLLTGDLREAKRYAQRAVRHAEALLSADATNTDHIELASLAHANLAHANLHSGAADLARSDATKALAIGETLPREDENALRWDTHIRAEAALMMAHALIEAGQPQSVGTLLAPVESRLEKYLQDARGDTGAARRLCELLAMKAGLMPATGARAGWRKVWECTEFPGIGRSPEVWFLRYQAAMALGNSRQVAQLRASLDKAGFRYPDYLAIR